MATTLVAHAPVPTVARRDAGAWIRSVAGAPMLLGVFLSFLGFAWDIQWHSDVGPDSFFTAPHLVLYSGTAIAGLTCLAVVLLSTWYLRRGATVVGEGTVPVLRGAFRAPAGYVIGGFGALSFLLYGLLDQWWHSLYGFDVTLISPPHVGLVLSIFVTMIGALVVFAGDVRRAAAHGERSWGASLALAAAMMVAFVAPTMLDALPWRIFGRFDWTGIVVALLYPAFLLAVASVLRGTGGALLAGFVFTLLRTIAWFAAPVVTVAYAASVGLFLRDTTDGSPVVAGMLPAHLLAAGAAVELVLWAARRRGWPVWPSVALAEAVAALTLRLLEPTLAAYTLAPTDSAELHARIAALVESMRWPTLLIVPVIGALSGWFGWLVGVVLRQASWPSRRSAAAAAPISASATVAAGD